MAVTSPLVSEPARRPPGLTRDQLLELYYYMRLTRSLEERLVNLYRQTKVVGGLFRSLGQEADAVGSAYALDRGKGDVLSPLIRNLGSMLVQGATPLDLLIFTVDRPLQMETVPGSVITLLGALGIGAVEDLVLFGGTGDLARRKILPALSTLRRTSLKSL
mgnify:CR=1 FL=1